MPVLLVPASYEEGKTGTTTAIEAEKGNTQGVVVETTMGEVRLALFPLLPLRDPPSDRRGPVDAVFSAQKQR